MNDGRSPMGGDRVAADRDDGDGTWRYAWPGGERLIGALDGCVDPAGLRVIDLGCGRGRLGGWALSRGAAAVVFADGSAAALAALDTADARASTLLHRWGEPLPACELLLGGDILYRAELHAALLDSVASAIGWGGTAFLSDPRRAIEPELARIAAARGLAWHLRPTSGGTLVQAQPLRLAGSRPQPAHWAGAEPR